MLSVDSEQPQISTRRQYIPDAPAKNKVHARWDVEGKMKSFDALSFGDVQYNRIGVLLMMLQIYSSPDGQLKKH